MDQRDYVRCSGNGDGESAEQRYADEVWPNGDGGPLTPCDLEWLYSDPLAFPLRRKPTG